MYPQRSDVLAGPRPSVNWDTDSNTRLVIGVPSRSMNVHPPSTSTLATPSEKEIGRAQSELQSQFHLVCRLLLEKKKKTQNTNNKKKKQKKKNIKKNTNHKQNTQQTNHNKTTNKQNKTQNTPKTLQTEANTRRHD